MTRRRSSAPGRVRPDRRRSLLVLSLAAAVALAACGGAPDATPTPAPTGPSTIAPTAEPTADAPSATVDPGPTELPTAEPTAEPTETDGPTATPGDGAVSPAADCAGSDENRDFYASVANAVAWPVYCPTVGNGWFVDAGQYRLAGGGWMEIAYRGPEGARIELREGFFCEDDCVPAGDDLGGTAFGDRSGTLIALGDGAYAVVADGDGAALWILETNGLAEDDVRTIAAGLIRIAG